ncbi:uncharacterized protein L201_000686 [Kwoniella dendrophila CBS 6074]|uniref:GH18 domain-containing protein n=1 Tax=Kwoniella dendrophila CBS 6074 TaxID=1295534 RepID=A0AAX4JLQ1_9TREE
MTTTLTYSTFVALFGILGVLGLPAPLPQTSNTAAGVATGGGAGAYTCQGETKFTFGGVTLDCAPGTVCKDGACVASEGAGNVALVATDAASSPANSASAATGVPAASSASIPAAAASSAGGGGGGGSGDSTSAGTAVDNSDNSSGGDVSSASIGAAAAATGGAMSTATVASNDTSNSASSGSNTSTTSASSALGGSSASNSAANLPSSTAASSDSTTSSATSSGGGSGQTRFVGYWENYSNLGGVDVSQLDGMTHMILSFIDMTAWTTSVTGFAESSNGNFDVTTAKTIKGMKSDIKVTAALGGWALDGPIKLAADDRAGTTYKTFIDNAKAAVKNLDLDGLDLDWEFPTSAQQPAFVKMCKDLKKAIQEVKPDGILSVAIGSRFSQTGPTGAKDVDAMTSETFKELNDVVDMWNVMTYDFVNRYDTETGHQGGGKVVEDALAFYEKQGIDLSKVNIGFLNTAKYFDLEPNSGCSSDKPIGCKMGGQKFFEDAGGVDNGKSGWLRYNSELDKGLGETLSKINADKRSQSWLKKPDDSKTAFKDVLSHAWFDENQNVFWTWTSPDDNKQICEKYKSKVGGMMVWSMNQDDQGKAGGEHMKALAECVKG